MLGRFLFSSSPFIELLPLRGIEILVLIRRGAGNLEKNQNNHVLVTKLKNKNTTQIEEGKLEIIRNPFSKSDG